MTIFVSPSYKRAHLKLTKTNPQLAERIKQKLVRFQENPTHPSLRLHKLTGEQIDEWSISIMGNVRIIFQYIPEGILLTDIGSHDEVY